jgi:hypothetical protein
MYKNNNNQNQLFNDNAKSGYSDDEDGIFSESSSNMSDSNSDNLSNLVTETLKMKYPIKQHYDNNDNEEDNDEKLKQIKLIEDRMKLFKNEGKGNVSTAISLMDYLNQYMVNREMSDKSLTHGFMGLRKFIHLDIKQEYNLLKSYYNTVFPNGEKQVDSEDFCLAQCLSSPLFIWFCDLDIKSFKEIETKIIFDISRVIVETLKIFFPQFKNQLKTECNPTWSENCQEWIGSGEGPNRYRLLIASSGKKEGINKKGQNEYGLGVHIYSIGRLRVTSEQALIIRRQLILRCEEELGYREKEKGDNTWEEVIDESVYKGNGGMRMLYCSKVKQCNDCSSLSDFIDKREEDKQTIQYFKDQLKTTLGKRTNSYHAICKTCNGRKKLLIRQSYRPIYVIDSNGKIDEKMDWLINDKFNSILASSFRTAVTLETIQDNDLWIWPIDLLGPLEKTLESLNLKPRKKRNFTGNEVVVDNGIPKVGQYYSKNSIEMKLCLQAIENIAGGIYRGIKPEHLKRHTKSIYYLNVEKGPDNHPSRFCLTCNKHHENRSFFTFTQEGVCQKSYSTNCDKSKIVCFPISNNLIKILFGQDAFISRKKKNSISICEGDTQLITTPQQKNNNNNNKLIINNNGKMDNNQTMYFNFVQSIQKSYVNTYYFDKTRDNILKNESTKLKTKKQPKKQQQKSSNYIPEVYIDDNGNEQKTTTTNNITSTNNNNKNDISKQIVWHSRVSTT